ncbi:MAG: ABC transporter ATP-binding protein [Candidatus Melainabacteria bacterium]|nr:ABC transporter ATP-binding protein [Candidatus Melainabacteria bacterium]
MTLVVNHLKKRFYDPGRGEFFACDDISFEVAKGEIFGLLGPNGAGKTTTLRIISTILKATEGSVTVCGHNVEKEPEAARALIGFLSSTSGLYERLTVTEILQYFGRLCQVDEKTLAERIKRLLSSLQLEPFAKARCGSLSQGTRQKVAIARAIIHEPELMILDEPANGLDVLATQVMHDFVRESKAQGKSIVLSTHIMGEAEKLCDRIGIINSGRLLACGTLDELKQQTGGNSLEEVFISLVQDKNLERS